jgi:hypothetical protein
MLKPAAACDAQRQQQHWWQRRPPFETLPCTESDSVATCDVVAVQNCIDLMITKALS